MGAWLPCPSETRAVVPDSALLQPPLQAAVASAAAPGRCAHPIPPCILAALALPQALEAVKLLSGVGEPLSRRLLAVDCAAGRFHTVRLRAK